MLRTVPGTREALSAIACNVCKLPSTGLPHSMSSKKYFFLPLFLIPRPFLFEIQGRQRRREGERDIFTRENLIWMHVVFGLKRPNPARQEPQERWRRWAGVPGEGFSLVHRHSLLA